MSGLDEFEEIEKSKSINQALVSPRNQVEKKVRKDPTEPYTSQINQLNFLVHQYFTRNEFVQALEVLSKYSKTDSGYESPYSLIIKALIKRSGGEFNSSLSLFKQSYSELNDMDSIYTLKEIGKTFLLLGKFSSAIEIYDNIIKNNEEDWDSIFHKGLCLFNMERYSESEELLKKSYDLYSSEDVLIALGKLYAKTDRTEQAIEKFDEALDISPNNADLYAAIGSLYLRNKNSEQAFDYFTSACKLDNKYSNALLGIASIHQYRSEFEEALIQYKISSISNPNSALVWNNLGLCFFTKNKKIAALTCLKKANYLAPFEWIISFNLGLVYLSTEQYASAFIYMNSAANLKRDYYLIFMYLGMILTELDDIENAKRYYDKALNLKEDYVVYYNYLVSLIKKKKTSDARSKLDIFLKIYGNGSRASSYEKQIINESMEGIKKILN